MRRLSSKMVGIIEDKELVAAVYKDWKNMYSLAAIVKKYDLEEYAIKRIVEYKENLLINS